MRSDDEVFHINEPFSKLHRTSAFKLKVNDKNFKSKFANIFHTLIKQIKTQNEGELFGGRLQNESFLKDRYKTLFIILSIFQNANIKLRKKISENAFKKLDLNKSIINKSL